MSNEQVAGSSCSKESMSFFRNPNWLPFPINHSVIDILNLNFAVLKNLKLFSIRVRQSFEPNILLRKQTTGHVVEKPILELR